MCRKVPGLPPVPTLVIKGKEPEGLCELVSKWPIQEIDLLDQIAAAGGWLDAP